MKKLPALVVVILALLMQLRVVYACEAVGFGAAEPCKVHALVADPHGEAPQDRGSACDVALDLASRNARQTGDQDDLAAQLTDPQPVHPPAAWPQPLATAPPQYRPPIPRVPRARHAAVASPGSSTYLVTARLRI
ncbi:hypothetical protein [uncultured Nevskia sp.]|uniref:hypothetical protein n=1 Tax=uncultured Nevskia sp. TaxID=228950 RepID=UPI0025E21A6D|nr:hypothetical protein [uncultured Nevskia sp.]